MDSPTIPLPPTMQEKLIALQIGKTMEIEPDKIRSWRTAMSRIKFREYASRKSGDVYLIWRLS